jgi:hypothetical protein
MTNTFTFNVNTNGTEFEITISIKAKESVAAVAPAAAILEPIRRAPVDSSNIAAIGYRATDGTLEIEFKTGSVYRYLKVSQYVYDDLLNARSVGSFFNSRIKDEFETVKIKS